MLLTCKIIHCRKIYAKLQKVLILCLTLTYKLTLQGYQIINIGLSYQVMYEMRQKSYKSVKHVQW